MHEARRSVSPQHGLTPAASATRRPRPAPSPPRDHNSAQRTDITRTTLAEQHAGDCRFSINTRLTRDAAANETVDIIGAVAQAVLLPKDATVDGFVTPERHSPQAVASSSSPGRSTTASGSIPRNRRSTLPRVDPKTSGALRVVAQLRESDDGSFTAIPTRLKCPVRRREDDDDDYAGGGRGAGAVPDRDGFV